MRHKNTIKFFGLWQGYPSGRFSRRFAPQNDRVLRTEKKKFCLLAKNGVIDLRFLFYPVQRALFVVAFVAKYERYIVAHDAKEFQKTFRLGHGKVARQYRRNGQGKICEFNDVEPRKFHKAVYAVSAHTVLLKSHYCKQ